jgi:hypothetical protein
MLTHATKPHDDRASAYSCKVRRLLFTFFPYRDMIRLAAILTALTALAATALHVWDCVITGRPNPLALGLAVLGTVLTVALVWAAENIEDDNIIR